MSPPLLLDGTSIAQNLLQYLAKRIREQIAGTGTAPTLATVLVGNNPASHTYVRMKMARCHDIGITPRLIKLSAQSTTEEVVAQVESLSEDPSLLSAEFSFNTPHRPIYTRL